MSAAVSKHISLHKAGVDGNEAQWWLLVGVRTQLDKLVRRRYCTLILLLAAEQESATTIWTMT